MKKIGEIHVEPASI
jgi:hypothetical protein